MKNYLSVFFLEMLRMAVLLPFGFFFYLEFKRRNDTSMRYGRWRILQGWGKPWLPFVSFI